ncbi:MAG: tellurite resistance/C4-dicarboxylate transporter family protein [Longimicrobiales bacterium]
MTDGDGDGGAGTSIALRARVADLPPAAFSVVMATGIVSTAADLMGARPLAVALLALNLAIYLLLVGASIARIAGAPDRVRADFRSHAVAPGFFTMVAGTCVLGTELVVLVDWPIVATVLWGLGIVLWIGLIYGFFFTMTTLPAKPPLEQGLNGSWMLIVVATQSVSALGSLLGPELGGAADQALSFALGLFLLGCMFYILLFSLILLRFLFFPFDPAKMTPPYWINMGAVAITTLAGSHLMLHAAEWDFLSQILPFLRAFTLLFWATATWWIPLLILLGAWRHIGRRVPLRYDFQYWSMVFPLGMYAVATFRLGEALGWPFLEPVPILFGYLAIVAWIFAFTGLVRVIAGSGRGAG